MYRLVLLAAAILALGSAVPASAAEMCGSSNFDNCEVYDCIEKGAKCAGEDCDYTANFGPKYCKRFLQTDSFSAAGKAWRDKTRKCLARDASRAFATPRPTDCKALEKAMLLSHTGCYVSDPSFCSLADADIKVVARIVDAADLVRLVFSGLTGVESLAGTFVACAKRGTPQALHTTKVFMIETLSEGTEESRNFVKQTLDSTAQQADAAGLKDFAKGVRELRQELVPDGLP